MCFSHDPVSPLTLAEHLLSHLEEAKGVPQTSQSEGVPEKVVEAPAADQPVISEGASPNLDTRRKPRRGRKSKTAKTETPLVVVEDKDPANETGEAYTSSCQIGFCLIGCVLI